VDPSVTAYDKAGGRHRVQTRYYHITNDNENNQSNKSDFGYMEYQYQRKFEKLGGLEVAAGMSLRVRLQQALATTQTK
jgi:hypothetical protein